MASPLAILTVDTSGAIRFVNPSGLSLFARSEEALVGASLAQLAHPVSYTHLTLPTNREV